MTLFCGVGPALANIITEESLVSDVLAADLNPEAIGMLLDNLRDGTEGNTPKPLANREGISGPNHRCRDATELSSVPEMRNSWDMLVVNLPHKTIEMLPNLVHLLDNGSYLSSEEGNCRRIRNRRNYRENRRNRIPHISRPTICQPQSEEGLQHHPETLLFRGMDRLAQSSK